MVWYGRKAYAIIDHVVPQILNRTNNIFELVTVEAVMHEKAPDKRNELLRLSDETDFATDKNLRLKGKINIYFSSH